MLDADGATKVNDAEKLENQVCINSDHTSIHNLVPSFGQILTDLIQNTLYFASQIHAAAKEEFKFGDSPASNSSFRISDIPIAAFGSRAHLEEKALATVESC